MGLKVVHKSKKATHKTALTKSKPKGGAKSSANTVHARGTMLSAQDREYMAEDDARTLMRAEEIKRDAARLRKAKAAAQKKADEALKVAKL